MLKTQIRVIDRRVSAARAIERMESGVSEIYTSAAKFMVDRVVDYSPVDTGTYMDSHNVRVGRDMGSATETSNRKAKNQSYAAHSSEARSRMNSQIDSLGGSRELVIANDAVHARYVEYGSSRNFARYVYLRARQDTITYLENLVRRFRL